MSTTQISARIPAELKARLDALKQPGESLADMLERAVMALESAPATDIPRSVSDGLEARIAALEAWRDSKR